MRGGSTEKCGTYIVSVRKSVGDFVHIFSNSQFCQQRFLLASAVIHFFGPCFPEKCG